MEAWDQDIVSIYGYGEDDLIDKIKILGMDTVVDSGESNIHTIQGENGIGNFTLIYYNLTTDPNACRLMDNQTFSISSPTPPGK